MELQHHWRTEKILSLEEAAEKAAELKAAGKKVVTLNGSFDLVHAGHLDMLEEAKLQGDLLFIGLNTDESIRNEKGPARPYIPQQERVALLAALVCTDYVTVVDATYKDLPSVFIRALKPDIHVNGSEYGPAETWVEKPAMDEVGAVGYTVARRPGLATSDIVAKIKSA